MSETSVFIFALFAGVALGVFFFGGLWWTTRKIISSAQPVLWFLGGLLSRMTVTLSGFYLVAQGNWQRLLFCVLGFFLARTLVMWLTRIAMEKATALTDGRSR